jgi:hypothetical protein
MVEEIKKKSQKKNGKGKWRAIMIYLKKPIL